MRPCCSCPVPQRQIELEGKGEKRQTLGPAPQFTLCHQPCRAPGHGATVLGPLQRTLRPMFASFALSCHLFIRGKIRVAGSKLSLLELCQVQSPILIFCLSPTPPPQHFQNSYLWRPCMVSIVWVVGLSSQVTIAQVQTISCVLTASLANCRRH